MSTQDNLVDANELEAALAHMKQMQNDQLTAPPRWGFGPEFATQKKTIYTATKVRFFKSEFVTKTQFRREEPPDFLAQLDTENRDVKTELSELQAINNKNYNNNLHNNNNNNNNHDDNNGCRCSTSRQLMNWRRQEIFCESRFHQIH